jgi:biopolymer transport protein ExbD
VKLNLQGIRRKPRIEMLPLIDIVFLLLVFFIYAMLSMAVHRGIPVELPTGTSTVIDREATVAVTLKDSGPDEDATLFINEDPVSPAAFSKGILAAVHNNLDDEILLFADQTVSYKEVFQMLDLLRNLGLHRISLQAETVEAP